MEKIRCFRKEDAIKYLILGGKIVDYQGRFNKINFELECQYIVIDKPLPTQIENLYRNDWDARQMLQDYFCDQVGISHLDEVFFTADNF